MRIISTLGLPGQQFLKTEEEDWTDFLAEPDQLAADPGIRAMMAAYTHSNCRVEYIEQDGTVGVHLNRVTRAVASAEVEYLSRIADGAVKYRVVEIQPEPNPLAAPVRRDSSTPTHTADMVLDAWELARNRSRAIRKN